MQIIIAEDDPVSRRVLEATLQKWEYQPLITRDGNEAAAAILAPDAPKLAILDWMMPGIDGPDICAKVRARSDGDTFYILMLTAKTQKDDIVAGLHAGANDYITKPFHREELRARLESGRHIVELQQRLAERVRELERALNEVQNLSGLLPICSYCKRIREGTDYWQAVENYIANHSAAQFSHGVCPDCYERIVKPQLEQI
jgi:phosphoserine phosphatase RsbU/P